MARRILEIEEYEVDEGVVSVGVEDVVRVQDLEDAVVVALKRQGWDIRHPGDTIAWKVGAITINLSQLARDMLGRL